MIGKGRNLSKVLVLVYFVKKVLEWKLYGRVVFILGGKELG